MEVTGNHHGLAIQRFGFDRYTSQNLLREADLVFSRIELMTHGGMEGTNEDKMSNRTGVANERPRAALPGDTYSTWRLRSARTGTFRISLPY